MLEFVDGQLIPGTRYRVHKKLGQGGMGTVYEVIHKELGKHFVLKALLADLSSREDLVQRLKNEWRALGRLEHPNIVTVTDAGATASGVPFFVMELLAGETLADRLQKVGRMSIASALKITIAILDGISAAHAIGIVHRDLKPPNVMLVDGDEPKILDFGIAKIADDPRVVTLRGVAVGTPRYMSPEQARGESVDGRADIYAAGLLLFEMITGQGPFEDARDTNELILAHIARLAPPISSLVPVSPELDRVVASMLHKNHEMRPPSARAAVELLRKVLSGMALAPTEPASSESGAEAETHTAVPALPPRKSEKPSRPQKPPKPERKSAPPAPPSAPLPPLTLTPVPAYPRRMSAAQLAVGAVVLVCLVLLGLGVARRRSAASSVLEPPPGAAPRAQSSSPPTGLSAPETREPEPSAPSPALAAVEPKKKTRKAEKRGSSPPGPPGPEVRPSPEVPPTSDLRPAPEKKSTARPRETRLPLSGL